MKKLAILTAVSWCLTIAAGIGIYLVNQENNRLQIKEILNTAEISVLEGEVRNLQAEPTYDDGYRDAIVKSGGGRTTYEDGYHAAILQMEEMKALNGEVTKETESKPAPPEKTKTEDPLPGEISEK